MRLEAVTFQFARLILYAVDMALIAHYSWRRASCRKNEWKGQTPPELPNLGLNLDEPRSKSLIRIKFLSSRTSYWLLLQAGLWLRLAHANCTNDWFMHRWNSSLGECWSPRTTAKIAAKIAKLNSVFWCFLGGFRVNQTHWQTKHYKALEDLKAKSMFTNLLSYSMHQFDKFSQVISRCNGHAAYSGPTSEIKGETSRVALFQRGPPFSPHLARSFLSCCWMVWRSATASGLETWVFRA